MGSYQKTHSDNLKHKPCLEKGGARKVFEKKV